MLLYRIAKESFINDFSGKGAELFGGRWNLKGLPAVYTASSLSLCICETLVHSDKDILPSNMFFAEISLPNECILEDFFNEISLKHSLNIGSVWLKELKSLAIKVPSVLMPQSYKGDFNVIINPLHKDFPKLKIQRVEPINFDTRFYGNVESV